MANVVSENGWELARGMIAAVAVAFVVLTLRVISKLKLRQFNIDDVLMIIAWVCPHLDTSGQPNPKLTRSRAQQ